MSFLNEIKPHIFSSTTDFFEKTQLLFCGPDGKQFKGRDAGLLIRPMCPVLTYSSMVIYSVQSMHWLHILLPFHSCSLLCWCVLRGGILHSNANVTGVLYLSHSLAPLYFLCHSCGTNLTKMKKMIGFTLRK